MPSSAGGSTAEIPQLSERQQTPKSIFSPPVILPANPAILQRAAASTGPDNPGLTVLGADKESQPWPARDAERRERGLMAF